MVQKVEPRRYEARRRGSFGRDRQSRSWTGDPRRRTSVPGLRCVHPARDWNIFLHMTNRFGVLLHPDDVRWAAVEGVSETVIAAVLLLHERRVDEIVPSLSAAELEQVIVLVGRSPRVYPPGTLDALKQRKALVSPEPPRRSGESTRSNVAAEKQHAGTRRGQPETRTPARPNAGADDRRSVIEGGSPQNTERRQTADNCQTGANGARAGTSAGTRNETARRRVIVEDLMQAGLSIRMISEVTDIPRSSVHRAMGAVARAEAKKQVAVAEIAAKLLGKKLSHRGRGRA